MEHFPQKPEVKSGEAHAAAVNERASQEILLTDPRAQVYLARLAFPEDANAMNKWLEGEEIEDSLSRRYRAAIEDRECVPEGASIDVTDQAALQELLDVIRLHEPEQTVH